jgi:site-specific DNA-methyltransferase (adenine-specific)
MTTESPTTCGAAVRSSDLFGGSDSKVDTHCETPAWLFESLDREFGFGLDVCADEKNHKCARWYSYRENGLEQDWQGVVWCNPPFDRNKSLWVKKAYEESRKGATVVVLIPYSGTGDAAWFHDYGMKAAELRYVKGRCAYLRPDGSEVVVRTMLLVYRPNHNGTTIAVTYPPNAELSDSRPKQTTT